MKSGPTPVHKEASDVSVMDQAKVNPKQLNLGC